MTHKKPKRKSPHGGYAKGIVILIIVVVVAYWAYYSYSPSTTPPGPLISATTPSPATTNAPLQQGDFNITVGDGCVYVNQTTGQPYVRFNLYVTNRFNEEVQYVNGSAIGFLYLSNPNRQISFLNFSNPRLLTAPIETQILSLNTYFPIHIGDRTTFNATVTLALTIRQSGKNQEILLMQTIPVKPDSAYPTCST
jgi:hypothetical protein